MRIALDGYSPDVGPVTLAVDQVIGMDGAGVTRILCVRDRDRRKVPLPRTVRRSLHRYLRSKPPLWLEHPAPIEIPRVHDLRWDEFEQAWRLGDNPYRRCRRRRRA